MRSSAIPFHYYRVFRDLLETLKDFRINPTRPTRNRPQAQGMLHYNTVIKVTRFLSSSHGLLERTQQSADERTEKGL